MRKKLCPFIITGLVATLVLALGCGKKQNEEDGPRRQPPQPQVTELELKLQKQELICSLGRACPEYITKVAIVDVNKQLKFCTGFLTDEETVVTASSCLPDYLRAEEQDCKGEIFFFFSETNQKPTRVGCESIRKVSLFDNKEPYLWRSDVAYLKLAEKVDRRPLKISRDGMGNLSKFVVWSIDQINEFQGFIRKAEGCESVHDSYVNPLVTNESSPIMTLAGCDYQNGNSGSPILDYRGKLRGVVSRPQSRAHISDIEALRLNERPLKPFMHVTNFACAPSIYDRDLLNENECTKFLSHRAYDQLRYNMISEDKHFKPYILNLESSVNNANRYLNLGVRLVSGMDGGSMEIYPKCFKDVPKWIGEFGNSGRNFKFYIDAPIKHIKLIMDTYGRVMAREQTLGKVITNFEFNPRVLKNTRHANVWMWADGPSTPFEDTPVCPSLL